MHSFSGISRNSPRTQPPRLPESVLVTAFGVAVVRVEVTCIVDEVNEEDPVVEVEKDPVVEVEEVEVLVVGPGVENTVDEVEMLVEVLSVVEVVEVAEVAEVVVVVVACAMEVEVEFIVKGVVGAVVELEVVVVEVTFSEDVEGSVVVKF